MTTEDHESLRAEYRHFLEQVIAECEDYAKRGCAQELCANRGSLFLQGLNRIKSTAEQRRKKLDAPTG